MKKSFLTLAVLLGCTLSASAQKAFADDYIEAIPSMFTANHTPYLYVMEESYDEQTYDYIVNAIDIYDMDFNKVSSFRPEKGIESLEFECYIDKDGLRHDIKNDDLYLTQTFFNDDADWEYLVETDDAWTIKKTDGTVVGTIDESLLKGEWRSEVYVINGVIYTTTCEYGENDDRVYYFYTLPEFRKCINADASSIKLVPAMKRTVSKEAYDLAGRKATDKHSGIIIKDGKKMTVK